MSWAEDMGYDSFDIDMISVTHDLTWDMLCEDGYIWRDRFDRDYKPEDITDSHLLNILNFCKRNYRPEEQVEVLKQLAKKRGLI